MAAAHSDGQGWPKAIAKQLALDGHEHGGRLRWSGELSCSECKQRQFRGELAIRREDRAHPCIRSIREDRNHDAVMRIAAKLRSSGPILHRGLEAMEERRVTATSDPSSAALLVWTANVVVLLLLVCPCHRSCRRTQDDTLWHLARHDETPQRNEELARKRHDHRLARAAASVGRSRIKPFCQGTLLLELDKTPSQLNHATPDAGVSGAR